jgi:enoyl-CoA hydratase
LSWALACDLIVAAAGAKLGIPEVTVGLFAAGGGIFRLRARVGYGKAMEMAITGDPIEAQEAAGLGLVTQVTDRAPRSTRRCGWRSGWRRTRRWRWRHRKSW